MQVVRAIPCGKATSYGAVALALGASPRAVGSVMRRCKDQSVPCHRVIAADRRLGGYGGVAGSQWNQGPAVERKRRMLEDEGVAIDSAGRIAQAYFIDELPWRNVVSSNEIKRGLGERSEGGKKRSRRSA